MSEVTSLYFLARTGGASNLANAAVFEAARVGQEENGLMFYPRHICIVYSITQPGDPLRQCIVNSWVVCMHAKRPSLLTWERKRKTCLTGLFSDLLIVQSGKLSEAGAAKADPHEYPIKYPRAKVTTLDD